MNVGFLGGDFYQLGFISSNEALSIALFQILMVMLIYTRLFFFIGDKIKVKKRFVLGNKLLLDYFIFIVSVIYLYYSIKGGLSYSKEVVEVTGWLVLFQKFTVVFEISYVLIIYLFYRCNDPSKLYVINFFFIVLANLIATRTGVLLFLLPVFYMINVSKGKTPSSVLMIFVIFFGLFISPVVRFLKFFVGMLFKNDVEDIDAMIAIYQGDGNLWELYSNFFNISFERFQHVSNLSFLIDNSNLVQTSLSNYSINNHITIYLFRQFFSIEQPSIYLNAYLASFINGSVDWSTHSGITGVYYAIGLIGALYILAYSLLLFVFILYSKSFDDGGRMKEYVWLMTILLFIHGWFSAFYAAFYAVIVFSVIILILNYFGNKYSSEYK